MTESSGVIVPSVTAQFGGARGKLSSVGAAFSIAAILLALTSCSGGSAATVSPVGSAGAGPADGNGPGHLTSRRISSRPDEEGLAWVEETLDGFSLPELIGQLIIEWIPGGYITSTSPEFEPLRV